MNVRELIDELSALPDHEIPIQVYSQYGEFFLEATGITIEEGVKIVGGMTPTKTLVVRLR